MPKTESKPKTPKTPKPQRIKTKGGPFPQIRVEGGLDPVERIPCGTGTYVLRQQGAHYIYEWFPS